MKCRRFHWILGVALFFPHSSFSQAPAVVSAPGDGRVAEWMYGEHIAPIAKIPFTAKAELETVNQLPDGTLITHKTYNRIARDILGRTYNERRKWMDPETGAEPQLLRIELYDPATRTRTEMFPPTKFARQWSSPPTTVALTGQNSPATLEISKETIGVDTVEGVPVRGVRMTQTYKSGALGNDRPISVITEYWYSEELKINLLTKRTDPRFGVQTVRVTELARQEPDASLFVVSSDYRIVDETVPGQERGAAISSGASLAAGPLPAGVFRAGVSGTTVPACVYCPAPTYTDQARAAKIEGTVVLQVVVTAEGQAENISVIRGLGLGLQQKAIDTVRNWRFKPAHGPDGNPVATAVPVEVTFRIH